MPVGVRCLIHHFLQVVSAEHFVAHFCRLALHHSRIIFCPFFAWCTPVLCYYRYSHPLSQRPLSVISSHHILAKTARKDKVRNEEIRRKTGLRKLELIIKWRRLRWLGHVLRMEDSRIPRQATLWELRGYKRKPGRPRKNWMDIIRRDLKDMDWTSPGMKNWQHSEQNGVKFGVWPNAPIWVRDEVRFKVIHMNCVPKELQFSINYSLQKITILVHFLVGYNNILRIWATQNTLYT